MKKVYVCDKVVTLTDEEVKAMDAEVERRMKEDKPLCSSTRHYDSEGNRCNEDHRCVCAEIHAGGVYFNNPKIDAVWKARLAAQRRKRCKCYQDANYNWHTCQRCETISQWEDYWQQEVWRIIEGGLYTCL